MGYFNHLSSCYQRPDEDLCPRHKHSLGIPEQIRLRKGSTVPPRPSVRGRRFSHSRNGSDSFLTASFLSGSLSPLPLLPSSFPVIDNGPCTRQEVTRLKSPLREQPRDWASRAVLGKPSRAQGSALVLAAEVPTATACQGTQNRNNMMSLQDFQAFLCLFH